MSFGVRIGVRVNDADQLACIREHLLPRHSLSTDPVVDHLYSIRMPKPQAWRGVRQFTLVYSGHALVARTVERAEAFEAAESAIRFDVACSSTAFTFVHAGVVEWGGRAIVIPGSSFSGKSRLTEALVRAGAAYYSDEFAVFDRQGRVHPFPKPLSIRQPSGICRRIGLEELGDRIGRWPIRVGLVVSCPYSAGASWQPRQTTPGEGALRLLEHTVRARMAPAESLRTLARVVEGASVLVGERDEASTIVGFLLEAITSPARA